MHLPLRLIRYVRRPPATGLVFGERCFSQHRGRNGLLMPRAGGLQTGSGRADSAATVPIGTVPIETGAEEGRRRFSHSMV